MKRDASAPSAPARARAQVLVVDDEPDIRELLELTLVKMGLGVATRRLDRRGEGAAEGQRATTCASPTCACPTARASSWCATSPTLGTDLPVAVITAYGSAENAVAALKAGAFDYVSKPVGLEQLRALVQVGAVAARPRRRRRRRAEPLLGESAPLAQVRAMIGKLARTQAPVYISGESGSGKELAARLIHDNGARREQPFVPVNCGAIPENLMESEFFGYKQGRLHRRRSEDRDGFFQAANGGTLFLDEVAELPLRDAGEAAARDPGEARAQGRRDAGGAGRRAHHLRHPPEPRRAGRGRALPPGPVLPPERDRARDAAAARVPRGHPADRRPASSRAWRAQTGARARAPVAAGAGGAARLRLPGQRARAGEHPRARGGALRRGRDRRRRPAPDAAASARPRASARRRARAASRCPTTSTASSARRSSRRWRKTGFNRTAAAKLLGITFRQLRYRMQRLGIREDKPAA